MDYRLWIRDVCDLAERMSTTEGMTVRQMEVRPPLGTVELESLRGKWAGTLPKSIAEFWCGGSSRVSFNYFFEPSGARLQDLQGVFPNRSYVAGGMTLEAPEDIFPGNSGWTFDDEEIGEGMRGEIGEDAFRLWCETAVLLHVGNGDLIALDQTTDPVDPPVVYLSHDDDTTGQLAPSLSGFLEAWLQLSLIGPEMWLIENWRNPFTGHLNADSILPAQLRDVLTS